MQKTPKVYPWNREDVVKAFYKAAEEYTPELVKYDEHGEPYVEDELPNALMNVTSRLIEMATLRLNRVPDKSFLQFLSFADKHLLLPSPATVPVKFYKAQRAETDPVIPQYAQVSTQASDFKSPILFETKHELTIVKPDVQKLMVVDFDRGKFEDKSDIIEKIIEVPEKLYRTDQEFMYNMHLYHPMLEELGRGKTYWLQVVLEFKSGDISLVINENEVKDIYRGTNAFSFDYDDLYKVDYNLFEITVSYLYKKDLIKEIIKDNQKSIRNMRNIEGGEGKPDYVFVVPIKVDYPISNRTISGFSSITGERVTRTLPFITITMAIRNREYFNIFAPPQLLDGGFKLFYLPQIDEYGNIVLDKGDNEKYLKPSYEDIINIERAFYNDTEIDIKKPFYPFGERPELNDTFYLSSIFFGRAGEVCEIDLWLMGDLDPSWITDDTKKPFKNEQNEEQKPDTEDVMLGWEYFDGKEWKLFARIIKSGDTCTVQDNFVSDLEVIDSEWAPYRFIEDSYAFTRSAQYDEYKLSNPERNYPFIQFRIPYDIQKVEVNGIVDWWLRVRILKGNYGHDRIIDETAPTGFIEANFKPPIFRSFTVNFSGGEGRKNPIKYYTGFTMINSNTILTENDFSLDIQKEHVYTDEARTELDKDKSVIVPWNGFPIGHIPVISTTSLPKSEC